MSPQPPPPPAASSPSLARTSGLAIASLVLGILAPFSCGATALFGLALGIISLVKVRRSGGVLKGEGLALAGTIVSAVFLLFVPVFAAMLLPALAAAKQRAQTINCVNNEKQLALAMRIYAESNHNHLPPAATWCDAIKALAGSVQVFKCPSATNGAACDYAFNGALDGMDEKDVNPRTVMLFESNGGWNASGGKESILARHEYGRVYVVACADGSVLEVRASQLGDLRWNP